MTDNPTGPKIINTFQQRRQLQDAIAKLAETETELALTQAVRAIVHDYPHIMVLTVLLKNLETERAQLRGGLGHLARLLQPEDVVPALRSAAGNRKHSSQLRLNAATILEQYLREDLPAGLLSDLSDTDEIAFQSLREALYVARHNRHVLLEYVMQMRQEREDVAFMVLDLLQRVPVPEQVDALRLIAQDDRPHVAQTALSRLAQLDLAEAGPQIARAMHTLQFTLPPTLAEQARRTARKLQLRGIRYPLPTSDKWRALVGPAEATGNQTIWLICMPASDIRATASHADMSSAGMSGTAATGILITLDINLVMGLLRVVCIESLAASDLPALVPVGELITVPMRERQAIVLLEAPFDYGRSVVQSALAAHWQAGGQPLAYGEYTLYNDLIWQFAPPQLAPSLRAVTAVAVADLRNAESGCESSAQHSLEGDTAQLAALAEVLLQHPIMDRWAGYIRMLLTRTPYLASICVEIAAQHTAPAEATAALMQKVVDLPDSHLLFAGMTAGLRAQAGFLHIMGSTEDAQRAKVLADSMVVCAPVDHPLLLQLFGQALERVVS